VKAFLVLLILTLPLCGTTISVVPVFEPLSMHGTDVDEGITETGEALQATVASRPMALSGAMPEDLIAAIRSPHKLPSNNPNYLVTEANLLVLCDIGIRAETREEGLQIVLDVARLVVPEGVDLTGRQVLKLALVAIRKTLEEYQAPQTEPLKVNIVIEGVNEGTRSLLDLGTAYVLGEE
jgi:hypothetical protein